MVPLEKHKKLKTFFRNFKLAHTTTTITATISKTNIQPSRSKVNMSATTETMSFNTSTIEALRVVSLPREIKTTIDIRTFISHVTGGLYADSVKIVNMKTDTGVHYRSAFVDIILPDEHEISYNDSIDFLSSLSASGSSGIRIESRYIHGGMHFDNGKPMNHVKIVPAARHSPTKMPLALGEGEYSSLYIPVIPADLGFDYGFVPISDEYSLNVFFDEMLMIGRPSRVDFVKRSGREEQGNVLSAYVHFDTWYDNSTTTLVRKHITATGEFCCNGYYNGIEFKKFDNNRYITLKVNHKPIPMASPEMNIHQLAASKEFLEKQVSELMSTIEALQQRVFVVEADSYDLKCFDMRSKSPLELANEIVAKFKSDSQCCDQLELSKILRDCYIE